MAIKLSPIGGTGVTDHFLLSNIGVNTHVQIDTHIADLTIHYADAPADGSGYVRNNNAWVVQSAGVTDHTLLSNIGVNTHAQIDTHIADATIHYADAPADGSGYVRNNNAWVVQSAGVTDHTLLTNIGVNTHAQIDTHIADGTIHFTEASIDHTAIANIGVNSHAAIDTHIADGTIHFTEASIDHTAIANIGVNSHAQIDTHIADATIHFTEASIDHTAISNIGVNSHAQIDTHIADGTIHFTEGSIDHGSIGGLGDDDHAQYLLLAGRAGGQTAFGGTAAGELLTLQGSADADRGRILANGGITVNWDFTTDAINTGAITIGATIPASGGLISSNITIANTINVNNALFIMSAVDDLSTITFDVSPGFAVTTLFFARQNYRSNTPGVAPAQAYIYAAQSAFWLTGAGDVTTSNYRAVSFAPIIRVDNNGDDMRITNTTGLHVGPLYNTRNANSTADFGTIRGVHMVNAAGVLFGQSLGAEIATNWIGLDVEALTGLTVSGTKAAVRSNIPAGTNNRFLLNLGTAESEFGFGDIHLNDSTWLKMGNTLAAPDVIMGWEPSQAALVFSTFFGAGGNPMYLRPTAQSEWVFQHNNGGAQDIGVGFNVNAVTFGVTLPTPNSNNWFVQFAGPNMRQPWVNGEYSDVLWTASGSINIAGFTMSDVQAFKINSPSILLNGGTIDDLSNLFVEAMPSFGATRVQALRVLGRARVDGRLNQPSQQPAQITANQNDYQLAANNGQRGVVLLDSDAAYNITGIDASFGFAQDGERITLINTGGFNLTLTHQDAASTAAYRFISPSGANYILGPNESCEIYYLDDGTDRWLILWGSGA